MYSADFLFRQAPMGVSPAARRALQTKQEDLKWAKGLFLGEPHPGGIFREDI